MADKKRRVVRSQWNLQKYADPLPEFVDETTGEVKKGYPPSVVDDSSYEELSVLVTKFLRGDKKPRFVPEYELQDEQSADPEAAFEAMDPTRRQGFDLADAGRILESERSKAVKPVGDKAEKQAVDPGAAAAAAAAAAQPAAAAAGKSVGQTQPK